MRPYLLAAGLLLLGLAACAGPAPGAAGPPPFAADWQQHTRPLIHEGPGLRPGTTSWLVPTILARGVYKVISRDGGAATLIDGYTVEVDGNPAKTIHLLLPTGYANVEVLEERYVLDAKGTR